MDVLTSKMSPPNASDILSWTNQDPRESQLFNSWGVLYRFQTSQQPSGQVVTTVSRAVRANKEDRVAKLEWAPNGGLGRAIIGKHTVPMADLVRLDRAYGARMFNGPDGLPYRWRPSSSSPASDVHLLDSSGNCIAIFRPTRPTRYQLGDVYGELQFFRTAGAGTVMHPPMMDTVTVTAMLYRFCVAFGL